VSLNIIFAFILSILPLGFLPLIGTSVTRALLGDLRLPRILHYFILSLLGCVLFFGSFEKLKQGLNMDLALNFILLFICLVYAAVFAIVTNNIEDLEADKISNIDRPLVKGIIDRKKYLWIGIVCQIVAFAIAALTDLNMLIGIAAISLGYFVYSCQPFRLKRIPFLSKFIIGINSFCVAVCGFVLAGGNMSEFPLLWAIYILVPLALSANFIDLKDVEGDRATGIKTLPVMFGETKARQLIVFFTVCSYVMAAILLNVMWMYPLVAGACVIHLWLLFRRPYNEKPVFFAYLFAIFALNVLLLLKST
jgi:4-hydroxybenzoate polyprenyltransferase